MKNLKVSLIIVSILVCSVTTVNAQFRWGVKGGLNVSNSVGDASIVPDFKTSFHLGLMGQYMINPSFGIESGLYYSVLGGKDDIIYTSANEPVQKQGTFKQNPSYLQLPVMVLYKFYSTKDPKIHIYPLAGFYLGYGIAGKSSIKYNDDQFDIDESSNLFGKHSDYNRFDLGLSIGLAFEFNRKVIFSAGYERGLTKTLDFDGDIYLPDGDFVKEISSSYNQNIKVSLGYLF